MIKKEETDRSRRRPLLGALHPTKYKHYNIPELQTIAAICLLKVRGERSSARLKGEERTNTPVTRHCPPSKWL
jgi:hypothetical protein